MGCSDRRGVRSYFGFTEDYARPELSLESPVPGETRDRGLDLAGEEVRDSSPKIRETESEKSGTLMA